jgi:glycosyltransferase involved in cell wall biosynthesis
MSIRISAIICTHNRAAYLKKALQSLVDQTLPQKQYEIIVVDNGSTDNTKAIVEGLKLSENIRYIYEPIIGLSQARNTGWWNAQGEFITYLDDDAIACPEWLQRIVQAFDTVRPQPGSVGGKVIPIWEVERPTWLPKELERLLSIADWADRPTFLMEDFQFLAGTNVAYPRFILDEVGGFSISLGRKASSLLSSEEILLKRQLERRNLGSYYDPDIYVYHHISAERLTKRWFYRRGFWQGASDAILQYLETRQEKNKGRYIRGAVSIASLFRVIPKGLLHIIFSANSGSRVVLAKCGLYTYLGRAWMHLRIALGLDKATESD